MYQLSKSKGTGKFHVALFGSNHRMLSATEAFNSRKGALKNVLAQRKSLNGSSVLLQDNTPVGKPKMYLVAPSGALMPTKSTLKKPYVPNSRKKKS